MAMSRFASMLAATFITLVMAGSGTANAGTTQLPLKCGSDVWGYRHIQQKHQADWEAIAAYDGVNWRTAVDWAVSETLLWPASATYRSSNDTYLYRRQIQLRNKSTGKVVATKYVNVIIARRTQNIITAYPTNV